MSMTETPTTPAPIPKKRRQPRKAAKTQTPDEFAGVSATACCADCVATKCVITGSGFCGHPNKSSHPGAGPKVQARIAAVKKRIAIQKAAA